MNCVINVVGVQKNADNEENRLEFFTLGRRYHKNGVDYITYQETAVSGLDDTTTLLKIYPTHVVLVRMGGVDQRQEFRLDHKSAGTYRTPYGNFVMMMDTRHLEVKLSQTEGHIQIKYELEINGQWQSSNTLSIFVREEQYEH